VSLRGTADLRYWTDRLAPERLRPLDVDGRAEVLLIAADGRFHGIRFRELSFSVSATPVDGPGNKPGAFLLHAFNSSRFFARCERVFFSTPYSPGDVRLASTAPASAELRLDGVCAFRAAMAPPTTTARPPTVDDAGGWDGPVFFPTRPGGAPKMFFARIRGRTDTYAFDAASDSFDLHPLPAAPVFQWLRDSDFHPTEWLLRPDASHAKSKTCPRGTT
jgi:hypothetical protein